MQREDLWPLLSKQLEEECKKLKSEISAYGGLHMAVGRSQATEREMTYQHSPAFKFVCAIGQFLLLFVRYAFRRDVDNDNFALILAETAVCFPFFFCLHVGSLLRRIQRGLASSGDIPKEVRIIFKEIFEAAREHALAAIPPLLVTT
jgi:hypothetical protein